MSENSKFSNKVGSDYIPVYVGADGEVKPCNAIMISGNIASNNLSLEDITQITGTD